MPEGASFWLSLRHYLPFFIWPSSITCSSQKTNIFCWKYRLPATYGIFPIQEAFISSHMIFNRIRQPGNYIRHMQWTPYFSFILYFRQISHLPLNGFSSPTDTAAFLSSAIGSQSDSECPQDFYSGEIFQEETFQAHGHSSSQLGSKPNKCRLCDKVYARPSTLRTHMRTHSGEKPYQCHICLKSFSQDANLTAHLRIHSGEKPFKCLVCDRR